MSLCSSRGSSASKMGNSLSLNTAPYINDDIVYLHTRRNTVTTNRYDEPNEVITNFPLSSCRDIRGMMRVSNKIIKLNNLMSSIRLRHCRRRHCGSTNSAWFASYEGG